MIRALPRALQCGIRSPAVLSRHTNRKTYISSVSNSKAQNIQRHKLECVRYLSSGQSLCSKDPSEYSSDPEVKEWMKELQKDFSNQPVKEEQGTEGTSGGMNEEAMEESKEMQKKTKKGWSQILEGKYQKLDTHSQIIYDYDEERLRREQGLEEEEEEEERVERIKLERGETGVFDVEELVDLLKEENARDIVVIQIPHELKYADYMVIVSSSSKRHRAAVAQVVKKAYKMKKNKKDLPLMPEGKGTDWVAMDMGNIILHIMHPKTRETYDLETLWTVGPAFDEQAQVPVEEFVGVRRLRDPLASTPSPPASPPLPSSQAVT